jgi:gamma-glutamylputrescine oxidase
MSGQARRTQSPKEPGMNDADIKAYGQSWYVATLVDEPRRPRLSVDLDIDVCVIGGGLAGLTTAREIARSGWSVVVLEAGCIASGASGRSTGFVLPGFAADADQIVGRVGFDRAKSLWALSQAGLDYVRSTIQSDGMAGIDSEEGWLYVSPIDNGDEIARYVRLLNDLGCEIESWPTDRVRAVLHSERYFYAINHLKAVTINPLNYALCLAAAAEHDGVRIFENTPALSIDPQGVRKRIVTPAAKLRANHVVLAGNVQIGGLMPRIAATLLPVTTYVITTAPLGPQLGEAIGYRGAVTDTDRADNHYRIVGGDRLMLSGRTTTWVRNPRRYVRTLTADIKRTYPQLRDIGVDYSWCGTLGNTVHRMPQIGELGPGVWLASGFGGHGLNTTAMAGNLIARGIVSGDQTWREFTPFELVWAGGFLARAGVQIRNWITRYTGRIEQRRAKARELAGIRAREAEKIRLAQEAERQAKEAAEAERRAAEAEEAARLAAIAEAEEAEWRAAEAERQAAEAEQEAQRVADAEKEVWRAAESEEAERLATATTVEAPLQSEPPNELEQSSAAAMEARDGDLITPAEVRPEPTPQVQTKSPSRRSKNRRKRERRQVERS